MSIENQEPQEGKNIKETEEAVPSEKLWVKKENQGFSVLELQDFGRFLMAKKEHREGSMVCLQMSLKDPLEVRFFSDDPEKGDDVYHIRMDYEIKGFKVVTVQGSSGHIDALLEEFGFVSKI